MTMIYNLPHSTIIKAKQATAAQDKSKLPFASLGAKSVPDASD